MMDIRQLTKTELMARLEIQEKQYNALLDVNHVLRGHVDSLKSEQSDNRATMQSAIKEQRKMSKLADLLVGYATALSGDRNPQIEAWVAEAQGFGYQWPQNPDGSPKK